MTFSPRFGLSTLVNHVGEGEAPLDAHSNPIFQTSTFRFPDVATGAARFRGEEDGFIYTRFDNPNFRQAAAKIAALEGIDLLRAQPDTPPEKVVAGRMFSSGMAAITTAILARVRGGQTVIAQEALYGATYTFLHDFAPHYGIRVVWLNHPQPEDWERAFREHPDAVLAYAESPANPTMGVIDIAAAAEIAHRYGAWLMVDNTFATPYCQRPLTLGADVVVHSTTKYLGGHGVVVGGAVVSRHVDYVQGSLNATNKLLGGNPGPFDTWLTSMGLRTFELRMQRHCANAMQVAQWLEGHPAVERVYYPGLPSHPEHELAKRQMHAFGGMISFELKGGLEAGKALMERVRLLTLAVSLGTTDSLISHPASMTHSGVPPAARQAVGITDGLVRFSVGIENVEDILADLEQALAGL